MNTSDIRRVGIIGAGLMGHGIALQFALAGYEVQLNDISEDRLRRSLDNVSSSLETLQRLGLASDENAATVQARIHTSTSLAETVGDVDYVVEATLEDLSLKKRVFAELDRLSPGHAILSSNTSSFMPSHIAAATKRPERVLVAHWWNPPFLVPLVEVVRGPATSDETVQTTTDLLEKLGKRVVVLQRESPGFIGNRLQFALLREAVSIVEHGIASAEDVDVVVKNSFGRRLAVAGPFEVFDIAGWDTILAIISALNPDLESSGATPALVQDMVGRGELGVKSGKGFYSWNNETASALRQRVSRGLATIERLAREG